MDNPFELAQKGLEKVEEVGETYESVKTISDWAIPAFVFLCILIIVAIIILMSIKRNLKIQRRQQLARKKAHSYAYCKTCRKHVKVGGEKCQYCGSYFITLWSFLFDNETWKCACCDRSYPMSVTYCESGSINPQRSYKCSLCDTINRGFRKTCRLCGEPRPGIYNVRPRSRPVCCSECGAMNNISPFSPNCTGCGMNLTKIPTYEDQHTRKNINPPQPAINRRPRLRDYEIEDLKREAKNKKIDRIINIGIIVFLIFIVVAFFVGDYVFETKYFFN